jgi:hypothetical protein
MHMQAKEYGTSVKTFFRTGDGRLRGLSIAGCLYLPVVIIDLIAEGWRSVGWLGSLLLALGFFAMSEADANAQSQRSAFRSPWGVAGLAASLLGLGLLIYRAFYLHLS